MQHISAKSNLDNRRARCYEGFMASARKRHVQLELPKLDKNAQRRGGKRDGAGRPAKGERPSERHERRESFKAREPVHVVVRAVEAVGELRGFTAYHALRTAMVSTFKRSDFRIVHISIQRTHVHLIVEAAGRMALARGMQGFEISAARHLNAALSQRTGKGRRGPVFPDRYYVEILRSPRQTRRAINYVLNNWRHHGESQLRVANGWKVDPFSSAPSFDGFKDVDARAIEWPERYVPLPVWEPRTWLLAVGWKQHGLIGTTEVPGVRTGR
jgi:REP element-mobilizing transposase RayT